MSIEFNIEFFSSNNIHRNVSKNCFIKKFKK